MTIIVKGAFCLKPGIKSTIIEDDDTAQPFGDTFFQGDDTASLAYASDFALFKHHADILLTGNCHVPDNNSRSGCRVTFGVGNWSKSLSVFGNRYWVGGKPSEPQPFTQMGLNYENAFGGLQYEKNPVGKGVGDVTTAGGQVLQPLPNIETEVQTISSPKQHVDPAGFGPLKAGWGDRPQLKGTFDEKWLKNNWPFFPDDFDWGYYNAAPRDQQVRGYLSGDESLFFENMNSEHPQYHAELPGLRPRLFIKYTEDGRKFFQEIPLNLDTLSIDMDSEKLFLVWRGLIVARKEFDQENTRIFLAEEEMESEHQATEYYHQRLGELDASADIPFKMEPEEAPIAEDEADSDSDLTKEMGKVISAIRKQMKEAGVPSNLVAMISVDMDFDAYTKAFLKHYKLDPEEGQRLLKETKQKQKIQLKEALEEAGEDPAILEELDKMDQEEEASWNEETLRARIESGEGFEEEELQAVNMSGWNLSGLNFRGADLSRADLSNSTLNKTDFAGAILSGANLSGCIAQKAIFDNVIAEQIDLSRSDMIGICAQSGLFAGARMVKAELGEANLTNADFSNAVLAGANLISANLEGAIFDQADLSLARLNKVIATGTSFVEARLREADFTEALLKTASFVEADMTLAIFDRSDLTNATLETVNAEAVSMAGAILNGLRAGEGSNFQNSSFPGIQADGSGWVGADLRGVNYSGSQMDRADLSGANLTDANLSRVSLKGSNFTSATMVRCNVSQSNLFQSRLESADLTQTDFSHSNLYGSEVMKAVMEDTLFDGANIKMTKLTSGGVF